MLSINDSRIGSKETAMLTRGFDRIALAQCLVGALALGLIEHAQAQPVNPPTPQPSPTFNPSSPNTVTQPSYRPSSSATRSTVSGSEFTSPADEGLPRRTARSHRGASVYGAGPVYRPGPIVIGPPPVAYSHIGFGYPCAWQRSWDGYWFRTSPCSW
jgi:hypothetical protein